MTGAWDGRPENPERDGWHWLHHPEDLRPMVAAWNAELGGWVSGALHSPQGVVDLGFSYLGPALFPAEVAAREAAAAEAMREACASVEVRVTVPDGADEWSPLEAWEEALAALDTEFRAAIRARGKETKA